MKKQMSREEWERRASSNARTIEEEINSLRRDHGNRFGEFWAHVKRINEIFKTLKPLRQEDRERLWMELGSICEAAKKGVERRGLQSEGKRDLILNKIRDAATLAWGLTSTEEFSLAEAALREAMQWMKSGWEGFTFTTKIFQEMVLLDDGVLTKKDRDRCWQEWKRVKEILNLKRAEVHRDTYKYFRNRALDALEEAKHEPREAKSTVKEIHRELKGVQMNREQFQDVHDILNKAWEEASEHLKQGYQKRLSNHQGWVERMQGHIERWRGLIEKNEGVIANLYRQIDRCEEMEGSARTPEFADEVRGWINEKYQKIGDIEGTNKELGEKIRSVLAEIAK